MAVGTAKKAAAYEYNAKNGAYNNSTDTFSWVLVTDTYASIDNTAATLNLSGVTTVASAGAYVASSNIANTTWTQSAGVSTLDGDNFSFAASASNPVTARCLVIYNNTSATDDIVCVVDLTADGTTPADTTAGFTYNISASGIATVSV